ncbi:MAG TPA: OmpH family outer membrane protein [Fimbriimonadaceae bacterium]|nr:OmpH family outer membrane protein [Fimbriimonadaceae bacterium]
MQISLREKIAYLVAAGALGVVFATGFQGTEAKIGVVDISQVVEKSDFGQKNQEDFGNMKAAREGVLEFIDQYRVLTNEQALKLRELSLKPNATAAEKAELETLKNTVKLSETKSKELSVKTTLTPEERTLMQEFAQRSQMMEQVAQRWFRDFTNEMQQWADKQKATSIDRARESVNEVAKAAGYTVVFESGVAPYGANDLTQAALKAMNAKK